MTEIDLAAQARITRHIAETIGARTAQVCAAVALLDEGATVPFIARYRKEVTGGLDDTQLRNLQELLIYGRELEERRAAVIASVEEQGKMTEELRQAFEAADTKQRLEDLYLPYKPKRKTRAQAAVAAGLEPLADKLWKNPGLDPQAEAQAFVSADKGVADTKAALDGARDILAERFAENADMLEMLRAWLWKHAFIVSSVDEAKKATPEAANFRDYFDYSEALNEVASHRALALFRGRQEGVLTLKMLLTEEEEALPVHPCQKLIADFLGWHDEGRAADQWIASVIRWTWRVKCLTTLETELFSRLRDEAQEKAISVFGTNLKDLLLAAPAGHKGVIGLDPGIRTGVKVAVISETGAVLETGVMFPHEPRREWDKSIKMLALYAKHHGSKLISIGNGTASRETDKLAGDFLAHYPELGLTKVVVSEAGASVYSASAEAAAELPELEDCVNAVGVDVNTASAALLGRVAGLSASQAKAIVAYRDANGAFADRQSLMNVPRLGAKTFEQAAGFLRIPGGTNPLDASAVHPESYPVVEKIVEKTGLSVTSLIGNTKVLHGLNAADFTDDRFGLPTVTDIIAELEKPGRDPRPEFKTAKFAEGVHELKDLTPGMQLEGVVTNVAAFGAFVDIGVHQDGLVHVSELADRFVKDPRDVVKVGDIVHVRVLDVDTVRKRIALSMKTGKGAPVKHHKPAAKHELHIKLPAKMPAGAMAAAFAGLKLKH